MWMMTDEEERGGEKMRERELKASLGDPLVASESSHPAAALSSEKAL